ARTSKAAASRPHSKALRAGADDLRHAQPAETLPLGMEPPEGLKALAPPPKLISPAARTPPLAQHPTLGDRESTKGKILEPYLRRAPSPDYSRKDEHILRLCRSARRK